MSRFLQIRDQHSRIFGHRFLNSQLSLYIGALQLAVCVWALSQHVYSIVAFERILFCDFSPNSTLPVGLAGVDVIIFDVGLFHSLWGIHGCVAQHLDGGYGRFAWCLCHIGALVVCLPCAFMRRPKPYFLWPLLIQQSAYGIGLLILSLAALPRILPTFMGDLSNAPMGAILAYLVGTLMNFFLLYVYWHWYWHVEADWDSARKLRPGLAPQPSSRRPPHRPDSQPPQRKQPILRQPGAGSTASGSPASTNRNGQLLSSFLRRLSGTRAAAAAVAAELDSPERRPVIMVDDNGMPPRLGTRLGTEPTPNGTTSLLPSPRNGHLANGRGPDSFAHANGLSAAQQQAQGVREPLLSDHERQQVRSSGVKRNGFLPGSPSAGAVLTPYDRADLRTSSCNNNGTPARRVSLLKIEARTATMRKNREMGGTAHSSPVSSGAEPSPSRLQALQPQELPQSTGVVLVAERRRGGADSPGSTATSSSGCSSQTPRHSGTGAAHRLQHQHQLSLQDSRSFAHREEHELLHQQQHATAGAALALQRRAHALASGTRAGSSVSSQSSVLSTSTQPPASRPSAESTLSGRIVGPYDPAMSASFSTGSSTLIGTHPSGRHSHPATRAPYPACASVGGRRAEHIDPTPMPVPHPSPLLGTGRHSVTPVPASALPRHFDVLPRTLAQSRLRLLHKQHSGDNNSTSSTPAPSQHQRQAPSLCGLGPSQSQSARAHPSSIAHSFSTDAAVASCSPIYDRVHSPTSSAGCRLDRHSSAGDEQQHQCAGSRLQRTQRVLDYSPPRFGLQTNEADLRIEQDYGPKLTADLTPPCTPVASPPAPAPVPINGRHLHYTSLDGQPARSVPGSAVYCSASTGQPHSLSGLPRNGASFGGFGS